MESFWNPLTFIPPDESEENEISLTLLEEICEDTTSTLDRYRMPRKPLAPIMGMEVGDDRCDASLSPTGLAMGLVVQETIFYMKTSPEDTFISDRIFNFCEVSSFLPSDPFQSFDHCRKKGNFADLGFTDTVVLRLILDVKKGDGDEHSSTTPGKMHMLRTRLSTPRLEARKTWQLASLFQDAHLSTNLADEPKYLPMHMGGSSVPPLFDNWKNIYTYVQSYKSGTYARIYGTATAELRKTMVHLMTASYSAPILCSRLREKQEYFHGTWKEKVFIPEKSRGTLPEPLLDVSSGTAYFTGFTNRLERTKRIISERSAEAEASRSRRLRQLYADGGQTMLQLDEEMKLESKRARARYDMALSAKSALQNLLKRQANESDSKILELDDAFRVVLTGQTDFLPEDALWLYGNGRTGEYTLDDLFYPTRYFVREEVSAEETFKVSGLVLKPPLLGGKEVTTTTKVGLYQINSSMEEWADHLLTRLKEERDKKGRMLRVTEYAPIFSANPEWVNDDKGLIGRVLNSLPNLPKPSVGLISSDRRLANQMAETCNVTVYRASPLEYLLFEASRGRTVSDKSDPASFFEATSSQTCINLLDTGSLAAEAAKVSISEGKYFERKLRDTGHHERRFSLVELREIRKKPRREVHRPMSLRKWRSSRPLSETYSTHSSWERSSHPSTLYSPRILRSWRTSSEPSGN